MVRDGDEQAVPQALVDAAVRLVGADAGSAYRVEPRSGSMRLAASRGFDGFDGAPAALWPAVAADSPSATARARRLGERVVIDDVAADAALAGTAELAAYRASGVRAVVATPLVARDGTCLGAIATHWRRVHRPAARDLRLLDVLARQAADHFEAARARAALRADEERQRLAIESGRMGTFELDIASGGLSWSASHFELLGLPVPPDGRTHLKRWTERIHPEDRARVDAAYRRALEGDRRYAAEHRVLRADSGETRWLQVSGTVVGSSPERFVGLFTDITERKRAELALAASEARFRAVQESSIDGFMVLEAVRDAAGAIVDFRWSYANEAAARIVGQPAGWFPGRRLLEVMPGNREEGLFDGYVRVVETGEPWSVQFAYAHEGIDVHLRLVATKVGDGFAVSFADLTERARAEARVRESEDRLRIAMQAARAGAFDWNLGTGEISWSDGLYALLGVEPGSAPPGFDTWRLRVHPQDAPRVEAALARCIDDGRRLSAEYRLLPPPGAPAGSEPRWVQVQALVVEREGRPRRLVGAVVDIDDLKQAEARAWASERRFRLLADHVPALIWQIDADGALQFVNRAYARFFGLDFRAALAGGWQPLVHPDDLPATRAALAAAIRERRPLDLKARVRDAEGRWRWLHSTGVPRSGADGGFLGHVGMSHDVTELVESQHALEEADRRKDEFLATLAHELRNPLAPIRNAAQLLAAPSLSAAQLGWARAVIQRQVAHMALLLDDLLDISRITRGKLGIKRERCSLAAIVDAAVEAARPVIERKQHALVVKLPPEDCTLDADPLRCSQVLCNLLTNAAKYTDPGGLVELEARVCGAELVVEVRDTGVGLAPEALGRLFEMFSQVQATLDRAEGGLGIGLALVKGLVELHGGSVSAASPGPGQGSRFTLRLPLPPNPARDGTPAASAIARAPEGPDTGPAPAAAPPAAAAPPGLRVLVADDNEDAADSLAMLLRLEGHDVHVARGGRAALALAAGLQPQVALLDIGMPDLDGHAVALALRAEPWAAGLVLVAVTGWGAAEDQQRARAAGFDHHFTKPVDTRRLVALLEARSGRPAR